MILFAAFLSLKYEKYFKVPEHKINSAEDMKYYRSKFDIDDEN